MIKKIGGVFGRNPVFNNLTVLGTLIANVSGTITQALGLKSKDTTGVMQITGPAPGTTRVVTVPDANATMARTDAAQSFAGNQTLTDGNLVIGTSGKGIDFSATPGTGTSELFADYEEGTWTPSWSSGVTSYTARTGNYTKVGNQVTIWGSIQVNVASGSGGSLTITGLPFNAVGAGGGSLVYCFPFFNTANKDAVAFEPVSSYINVYTISASSIDNLYGSTIQNGTYIAFFATYRA
jgi:hypothetical protein